MEGGDPVLPCPEGQAVINNPEQESTHHSRERLEEPAAKRARPAGRAQRARVALVDVDLLSDTEPEEAGEPQEGPNFQRKVNPGLKALQHELDGLIGKSKVDPNNVRKITAIQHAIKLVHTFETNEDGTALKATTPQLRSSAEANERGDGEHKQRFYPGGVGPGIELSSGLYNMPENSSMRHSGIRMCLNWPRLYPFIAHIANHEYGELSEEELKKLYEIKRVWGAFSTAEEGAEKTIEIAEDLVEIVVWLSQMSFVSAAQLAAAGQETVDFFYRFKNGYLRDVVTWLAPGVVDETSAIDLTKLYNLIGESDFCGLHPSPVRKEFFKAKQEATNGNFDPNVYPMVTKSNNNMAYNMAPNTAFVNFTLWWHRQRQNAEEGMTPAQRATFQTRVEELKKIEDAEEPEDDDEDDDEDEGAANAGKAQNADRAPIALEHAKKMIDNFRRQFFRLTCPKRVDEVNKMTREELQRKTEEYRSYLRKVIGE